MLIITYEIESVQEYRKWEDMCKFQKKSMIE